MYLLLGQAHRCAASLLNPCPRTLTLSPDNRFYWSRKDHSSEFLFLAVAYVPPPKVVTVSGQASAVSYLFCAERYVYPECRACSAYISLPKAPKASVLPCTDFCAILVVLGKHQTRQYLTLLQSTSALGLGLAFVATQSVWPSANHSACGA